MFKPVLSVAAPLMRRRFHFGRRSVYAALGAIVVADLLFLALSSEGLNLWRSKGKGDITQQVSVEIQGVNPAAKTIRVVGDLVGIMGIDVVVTPQTWIGIDHELAVFGELRDGLRANISFVREGERRVARWIAASSKPSAAPSRPPDAAGARPTAEPVPVVPAGVPPPAR